MAIEITDEAIALLLERLLVPEHRPALAAAPLPVAVPPAPRRVSGVGTWFTMFLVGIGAAGGIFFLAVWFGLVQVAPPVAQTEQAPTQALPTASIPTPPPRQPAQQPISAPPVVQQPAAPVPTAVAPAPPAPPAPTPQSGIGAELTVNGSGAELTLRAGDPNAAPPPVLPAPSEPGFRESFAPAPTLALGNPFIGCLPGRNCNPGAPQPTAWPRPGEPGFVESFQ